MREFIVALNNYKLKTCLECGQVLMYKYIKRTRSEYWAHPEYISLIVEIVNIQKIGSKTNTSKFYLFFLKHCIELTGIG